MQPVWFEPNTQVLCVLILDDFHEVLFSRMQNVLQPSLKMTTTCTRCSRQLRFYCFNLETDTQTYVQ